VQDARPEEVPAARSADAAMQNDLQNLRLANHLHASRRELAYALMLVVLWVLLVPVTGALRGDLSRPHDTPGAVAPDLRHWAPRAGGDAGTEITLLAGVRSPRRVDRLGPSCRTYSEHSKRRPRYDGVWS
jgi:hypothetical protein